MDSYSTVEYHGLTAAAYAELEQADMSHRFASLLNVSLEDRLRAAIAPLHAPITYALSVYASPAALPPLWVSPVAESVTIDSGAVSDAAMAICDDEDDDTDELAPIDSLDLAEHVLSAYVSCQRIAGRLVLTSGTGEAELAHATERTLVAALHPLGLWKHVEEIVSDWRAVTSY